MWRTHGICGTWNDGEKDFALGFENVPRIWLFSFDGRFYNNFVQPVLASCYLCRARKHLPGAGKNGTGKCALPRECPNSLRLLLRARLQRQVWMFVMCCGDDDVQCDHSSQLPNFLYRWGRKKSHRRFQTYELFDIEITEFQKSSRCQSGRPSKPVVHRPTTKRRTTTTTTSTPTSSTTSTTKITTEKWFCTSRADCSATLSECGGDSCNCWDGECIARSTTTSTTATSTTTSTTSTTSTTIPTTTMWFCTSRADCSATLSECGGESCNCQDGECVYRSTTTSTTTTSTPVDEIVKDGESILDQFSDYYSSSSDSFPQH